MPETLVNYLTSHESFSVSGEKNRGACADFVHENSNKTTKSFLPPGMPTADVEASLSESYRFKYA